MRSKAWTSCSAPPARSIGLETPAAAGSAARSGSATASDSSGTSRPAWAATAAAMLPCPPPSPSTATRRPRAAGQRSSAWAASTSSRGVWTRWTPAAANAASMAAASDASAPVCDWTARAPAPARSMASATHGLAGAHGGGRGAGEGAAVTEVLDVDGDELGGVVGGELGHEVGGAEIGLVAQRREPGEPQPLRRGEQPQFQREVAALGDEPDRAGGEGVGDKLEPPAGVQDAEAVGPEQHRSRGADALGEGGVGLAGTRADDHDRAGAGGQGAGDGRVDGGGGDGDDHEVGRLGQLVQGPVGPPSQHRFARAVVDEERRPVRLAAQRSLGQPVAPLARVLRRADHRDGRRVEQGVDGAVAQRRRWWTEPAFETIS